jgi:hypothetical protein
VVITVAVVAGGTTPKPPTPHTEPGGEDPQHLQPGDWGRSNPESPPTADEVTTDDDEPDDEPPVAGELEERPTLRQRARSVAQLGLAVAILGAASAAVLGTAVLVGANALDRALG